MRVEITVAKTQPLPPGALEALSQELERRLLRQFPESDHRVSVRYASSNQLSVLGASKEDREHVSDLLQETWESADDWFAPD
ncbi:MULTISPECIES: DNA damage-inducible protein I [Pantoea]|uniref:DNA damage-inducible protein I n=1 Tax=Candidatus Pantoea multigeneris TaxID=2608357 RepID=A0ABX0R539_9GAMM|nr:MULTISPECIES: DNA damage-inducible protein I [Pantoea]NIF20520.1 DNA damage-inducible protein I [Pantoea multigeneris]